MNTYVKHMYIMYTIYDKFSLLGTKQSECEILCRCMHDNNIV